MRGTHASQDSVSFPNPLAAARARVDSRSASKIRKRLPSKVQSSRRLSTPRYARLSPCAQVEASAERLGGPSESQRGRSADLDRRKGHRAHQNRGRCGSRVCIWDVGGPGEPGRSLFLWRSQRGYELTGQMPDPRKMQVSLIGFMDKHGAAAFMEALWGLLISAQETVGGVPAEVRPRCQCHETKLT